MKKIELLVLSLILLLAFTVRLYKINRPIADWHSWRQADTAAVARNFVKEGFNPFVPRYDDMSSQANGLDNPNRYRFVEFPVYNAIIAGVWMITGINDMYARLVTVIVTLGSTLFLYLIIRHFSGTFTAVLAALFFATIPYNIFYSSAILPGPFMVFGILGLYYFFIKWLEIGKKKKYIFFFLSVVFANLAILSWPIALFFMLPVVYLSYEKHGVGLFKKLDLWLFAFLVLVPFVAWRFWISKFPEGIPSWQFLINENNIRFKGAFFRWLVIERLGKLILTVSGFSLFIFGVILKQQKEKLFYYSMLVSVALYFTVFASGNVRHDYYQVPVIPVLSIFMAKAVKTMIMPNEFLNRFGAIIVAVVSIVFMLVFGFYEVKGFYWINKPEIVEAGKAVDRLLPIDASVIAPYNGDAAFLYQTNRHGYPITDRSLEKFIDEGTKYLVSVDVNDAGIKNLAQDCKVIEQTDKYVIVEMFKECIGK